MQVINPTKDTLRVQIKGSVYVVEGESSLGNVPQEHAEHWRTNIHNFITIKKDIVVRPTQTVESPSVPTATVVEDEPEQEETTNEEETVEEDTEEDTEDDVPDVEVEMSYSEMQEKAKECGMEKVGGVSKANLMQFIKDNS